MCIRDSIYTSQKDLVEKFDYLYTHQNMIYQMGENNFKERDLFNWERISQVYKEKILFLS